MEARINEKTAKYRTEIQQMMFVSGESSDPAPETTSIIEDIVQQQVKEMLIQATALANRAGVRAISTDHLMFLIRHDRAKVSRLKNFLSWKDVRKTAKDSDDKPGGGKDEVDVGLDDVAAAGPGGQNTADAAAKGVGKNKRAKVRLPWDLSSFYSVQLPEREDDEADDEDEETTAASLQRLKNADERTRNMTREEYVHWSECRQASFTFRKGKRFRDWAGFGLVTDAKPNDDIIDILGFLTFEMVQTLTEEALKVKMSEDAWAKVHGKNGSSDGGDKGAGDSNGGSAGGDDGEGGVGGVRKRKREMALFDPPEEERTPVQPKHVLEAYRRLQQPDRKMRALTNFEKTPTRKPLKLI